ncbi:nuclear transport factor 2 family protein [Pedobacter jamesrossensis]|uniref:Nuclear transport factor 2 family protein n=1 Tax=Pedobacter jamesrossensis TaxID=1908238 RepID=A0ABV8NMC6_9SPHI
MAIEQTKGYQILQDLLNAFNEDTETVLALFNPEAIVEYPYAKSLGMSYYLTMDDYRRHLDNILGNMPDITFIELQVYKLQEQECYWAEFHGETTVPQTGALYQQDYVVNFKLENGKFSHYKEYWNVLPVLNALIGKEQAQQILDNLKN